MVKPHKFIEGDNTFSWFVLSERISGFLTSIFLNAFCLPVTDSMLMA